MISCAELDNVDSTNEEAFRQAAAGRATPFFISARQQSRGRGRSNRQWISPPGNLYLSCGLKNPARAVHLPQLGFVAGVALMDALLAVAPGIRFQLKWPNDVVVGGAKLAGILLESRVIDGTTCVVIGWGINVAHAPGDLPYPALALNSLEARVDLRLLRDRLIGAMQERLETWKAGQGFETIRTGWLRFAPPPGTAVLLREEDGQRPGTFEGIDETGRLRFGTGASIELIAAADVIVAATVQGAA